MMMPKKSGFLVLEKLRSRPGGLIPTIMITGNEGSRHRAYAEMLGVRDYIRKPFAMEKLVRSIDKVLGLSPRTSGGYDDEG
jgi:DNA-binding response OmpR family regulator